MTDKNRTRNVHKNFYFSEEESQLLASQAESSGLSEAEYIRMLLNERVGIYNRITRDNGKLIIDFSSDLPLSKLAQELKTVADVITEAFNKLNN